MTEFLQAEGNIALPAITNKPFQTIRLMITRASLRAPLIAGDFLLCLEKLIQWLGEREECQDFGS